MHETNETTLDNLRINTVDVRGFDLCIILTLRGGSTMSMGDIPESLSRAILAGMILVGRLDVASDYYYYYCIIIVIIILITIVAIIIVSARQVAPPKARQFYAGPFRQLRERTTIYIYIYIYILYI